VLVFKQEFQRSARLNLFKVFDFFEISGGIGLDDDKDEPLPTRAPGGQADRPTNSEQTTTLLANFHSLLG